MSWLETDPVTERKRFIMEWLSGELPVTELCRRHEISRKSGYKWIARYEREGPQGLEDRSRQPHSCAWSAEPDLIEEAIRIRYSRRQVIGARKIRPRLVTLHPDREIPSERTLHRHFLRRGLVKKRRRSLKRPHPGKPTAPFDAPNSVWSADFKCQFKTRDGVYCYPLTVQDGFSRYLLGCQGLGGTTFVDTKRVFTRLFHEFGLPTRIRTDNKCALRVHRPRPALPTLGLVDQARHPARPHRASLTSAERPSRAHAPDPQGRDHHPASR